MRTAFLSLVLVLGCLSVSSAAPAEPQLGTYEFVKAFAIEGVSQYDGGRGIDPHPVRTEKRVFKPGERIDVEEFYWDDQSKSWGAKLVFLGQNRSVPMSYLRLVKPGGP